MENNNTIYLIGNGFDLAHELPTSYNDYLINSIKENLNISTDASLLKEQINIIGKDSTIIKEYIEKMDNDFIKYICNNYHDFKWIDIENLYKKKLLEIVKLQLPEYVIIDLINKHNQFFYYVKNDVYNYLSKVEELIDKIKLKESIKSLFLKYRSDKNVYSISFNYTSTINLYVPYIIKNPNIEFRLIHINGKIYNTNKNSCDNIIFGCGDEYSSNFNLIKEFEDALKYYKSIEYSIRPEYEEINLIMNDPFDLVIMGHSCGITDRSLLSQITNHPNLRKIFIHCKDISDNYKCLQRLKQSTENGKVFNVNIEKGLC